MIIIIIASLLEKLKGPEGADIIEIKSKRRKGAEI
jgi:hypothetical protein